jgi:TPR repeat protein
VAIDYANSAKWYRLSAYQGDSLAQLNLGRAYLQGRGVPKDEVEAYALFNLAGVKEEAARMILTLLEKEILPETKLRGQLRTKELEREINEGTLSPKSLRKEIDKEMEKKGA